ncbi:MAG: Ig-like domain-containing protein [Candidatus Gracilibacteria bacterium]
MEIKKIIGLVIAASLLMTGCSSQDTTAPKVTKTFPENGAQNVDPQLATIWVQFDEPMADKSWAWAFAEKDKFPQLNGDPSYSEDNTKNTLPVKLEPNHEYDIWINSETLRDFKDKANNPAEPFELKFKTK